MEVFFHHRPIHFNPNSIYKLSDGKLEAGPEFSLAGGGGGGVGGEVRHQSFILPSTYFTEGRTDLTQEAIVPKGCSYQYFYSQFLIFQGLGFLPPVPLWINP